MTTVAVLGTGIMGAPMARNMAQAGLTVRAWNRTRDKADPLTQHGITVHDTAAEAVAGASLIVTVLSAVDAVLDTMTDDVLAAVAVGARRGGVLAGVGGGAVWLQMGSVGVDGTRRLQLLAEKSGIDFVDAPVSGTRQPAEDGNLTVIASGRP